MKLTRLVPAAVAAVALLAGCSPTPGTALVVDGTHYTEGQVSEIVDGCAEALDITPDQIRRSGVVGTLLLGKLFDSLVTDTSEADIQAMAEQFQAEQLFDVEACKPLALANIKTQLLGTVGNDDVILEAASALDVQLNPRYGKWDPASGTLLYPSGSLSEPSVSLR
ncbi:MAG: hypothetical protein Q4G35_00565 [Propionibacteriaceae bacterium]|nr:hypothetical protein [Propionibacteriaceae bacterium]